MIGGIGSVNSNQEMFQMARSKAPKGSGSAKDVQFSYNPQDQVVMSPTTTKLHNVRTNGNGPFTDRVKLIETKLNPSSNGSYVFKPGDKNYVKAASFATVQHTLSTFEKAYGGKIEWAFDDARIKLSPDAGEDLNAYYSRDDESLNFFHGKDPVTKTDCLSGASGEIVSHEVGHAMLDGLRPDYLTSWKADTNGFHEAFADLTGLFVATQNDAVCELAAEQTGGDFSKPNCLAATGEELGQAINHAEGENVTGGTFIRNAINNYKWQDPSGVPETPAPTPDDPDPLGTEMHSWSRIWTGAQYDMMGEMVKDNMRSGMPAAQAIKEAGSECLKLYGGLMKVAPKTDCTYREMALGLLKADAAMGGKNHANIVKCFTERNILQEGDDMRTNDVTFNSIASGSKNVTVTLEGSEYGMFSGAEVSAKVSDNGMSMVDTSADDLRKDMQRLIKSGCILYTEPNQTVERKDMFDKNGNPYMGIARWTDGKLVIERTKMIG